MARSFSFSTSAISSAGSSQLSRALARLGLQSGKTLLQRNDLAEPRLSPRAILRKELARSLMDGTPRGADAAARFEELSKLVTAIIGQHHHELAVRLHDTYRSFDPSEQRRQNKADRPTADSALAFSAALHAVACCLRTVASTSNYYRVSSICRNDTT